MQESSFDRFLSVIREELLVKNMEQLFGKSSGLDFILKNHIIKDMKLIYKLY